MRTVHTHCHADPALIDEHCLLVRHRGEAQRLCSLQAAEIEQLQSEVMLLRAALIVRNTRQWLMMPTDEVVSRAAPDVVAPATDSLRGARAAPQKPRAGVSTPFVWMKRLRWLMT